MEVQGTANGRNIRQQTVDFVFKILWLKDELTEADSDEKKVLLWKLASFFWSCYQQKGNRCSISVTGHEKTQPLLALRHQYLVNLLQNTANYWILFTYRKRPNLGSQ